MNAILFLLIILSYCKGGAFCDPNPCKNGGTCSMGRNGVTCLCQQGFGGDRCENVTLGGGCDSIRICADDTNGECKDGVCQCKDTHFDDNGGSQDGTCQPKIKLGGGCDSINICADNTNGECKDGVCQCKDTHFDDNGGSADGTCQPRKKLGETCTTIELCADSNTKPCTGGGDTCVCSDTHYDDNGCAASGNCVLRSALHQVCSTSILCMSPNALCLSGKCSCPESTHHVSNGDCLPDAYSHQQKIIITAAVTTAAVGSVVIPLAACLIFKFAKARKLAKKDEA